jgi:hypothetical protein
MALTGPRRVQLLFDSTRKELVFSSEDNSIHKTVSGDNITRVLCVRKHIRMTYLETFSPGDTYIITIQFRDGNKEQYIWDPLWARDASGRQTASIQSLRQSFIDIRVPSSRIYIHTRQWIHWLFLLGTLGLVWFTFF